MSTPITQPAPANAPPQADRFLAIRSLSEQLAAPLSPEDQTVQSMPDASPTKWHLAHTTWFFETFLLRPNAKGYRPFDPAYEYLFNSYYEAVGPRHPRPQRGMITRPGVEEILAYRRHVTDAMAGLIASGRGEWAALVELGLHHEQQHQELILTDMLHAFSCNPLKPAYRPALQPGSDGEARGSRTRPLEWLRQPGGVVGNVRITAHGALQWKKGEEVLLFLEPSVPGAYQVAGFSQGKYTIERDASGKAFVQHARPADAPDPRSTSGTQSARATETVTLEQFLDSVLPNE